jgi:hypothetical protein
LSYIALAAIRASHDATTTGSSRSHNESLVALGASISIRTSAAISRT